MSEESMSPQEGPLLQEDAVPRCRVAAVVPAAGCGERMAHPTPKQYLTVCGRPLVVHCLRALQEVPWVERVVVVAEDLAKMKEVISKARLPKVIVVQGGCSRHWSISVGVEALSQDPPDVVLVHDGVRPLLPRDTLAQVVVCAERHGAAGAVRPLVSTVLRPDQQGFLQESLARNDYRNSEMPQAFRFAVLRDAYRRCSEEEMDRGTECLALALHYAGVRAKLVPGTPHLWKVTEERDLVMARALLPRHTRCTAVVCRALTTSSTSQESPRVAAGVAEDSSPGNAEAAGGDVEDTECCDRVGPHAPSSPAAGEATTEPSARVPLACDSECLHVFTVLEGSLRTTSQHVCLSSNFDITSASSSCVVVITNLEAMTVFRECVQGVAEVIDQSVCTVILVFTLRSEDCDVTLAHITLLQQQLRDALSDHSANVTVILRSSSRASSSNSNCQSAKGKSSMEKSSQLRPPGCAAGAAEDQDCRLGDLVKTLLDQTTRCFHGQVLVL